MSPSTTFKMKTTKDLTEVIATMADKAAEAYVTSHTKAEVQARLQAVPDLEHALGGDAHCFAITNLEQAIKKYSDFVELFSLREQVRAFVSRAEVEKETEETVEDAAERVQTRASTPETEASTEVETSSECEDAGQEEDHMNLQEDDGFTNFEDPTNSFSSIPKKDDKNRTKLWLDMEVNTNLLEQVQQSDKTGNFYKSRIEITKVAFSVSLKEASIRPVVTFSLMTEEDVNNARALIDSPISRQYLTQPAMPVMVAVKFSKPSKLAEFEHMQGGFVNVELGAASIGQVVQAANLLVATQREHWNHGNKTWKWEAMSVPEKQLKGEQKQVMNLIRSNPVFSRTP